MTRKELVNKVDKEQG